MVLSLFKFCFHEMERDSSPSMPSRIKLARSPRTTEGEDELRCKGSESSALNEERKKEVECRLSLR